MQATGKELWAIRYTQDFAGDVERGYDYLSTRLGAASTRVWAWYRAVMYGFDIRGEVLYNRVDEAAWKQEAGRLSEKEEQELIEALERRFRPCFAARDVDGWRVARPGLFAAVGEDPRKAYAPVQGDERLAKKGVYMFRAVALELYEEEDGTVFAMVLPLPGPVYLVVAGRSSLAGTIVEADGRLRYLE